MAGQAPRFRSGLTFPAHRPWWRRVPEPVATAAVRTWTFLPEGVRARFVPLGRRINPHQSVTATDVAAPDTVSGVRALRAEGFEPLEEHTGALEVAELWPEEHRRWVPEARAGWLETPDTGARLWLVRSPWAELTLPDALNLLWSWAERDPGELDDRQRRARISEALRWDDATAAAWHRRTAG
jgi:hypothetical protein